MNKTKWLTKKALTLTAVLVVSMAVPGMAEESQETVC